MLLNILNLDLFGNVFGTLKLRYVNGFCNTRYITFSCGSNLLFFKNNISSVVISFDCGQESYNEMQFET